MTPRKPLPEQDGALFTPSATPEDLAEQSLEGLTMANDAQVAMPVVRLEPGAKYPAHMAENPTPMDLLTIAMAQGADLDRLERLMDMKERWDKAEAVKAFNVAFASFKSECVAIIKNVSVTDGPLKNKKYADLFAVVDAITPALSRYGLSASWKLTKDEPNWLEVACILKHAAGHFEVVTMGGPPDTGGAKNAIQARASSKSYLERYTLLAITGMAASGEDKDGRNADQSFGMDEGTFQGHILAIKKAGTIADLQAAFTTAWNSAKKDPSTQKAILTAKDERKAALAGGAK